VIQRPWIHRKGIYTLRPNLRVRFQNVDVSTNSFGMRGPEYPTAKADNVYRIALLGDSFVFGWGVEQQKIFSQIMETALNKHLKGKLRVEVLNFGAPGYSTFQEVNRFQEIGLQFSPDAVLVYFIDNDFGLPFFIKNFNKPEQLVSAHRIEGLKKEARSGEAQSRSKQLHRNLNPNVSLIKLADLARKNNFKLFVTVNPRNDVGRDLSGLWALRSGKDIAYISLFPEFREQIAARGISPKSLVFKNDPHPTAIWHEVMGQLLADQLLPYIVIGSKNSRT